MKTTRGLVVVFLSLEETMRRLKSSYSLFPLPYHFFQAARAVVYSPV